MSDVSGSDVNKLASWFGVPISEEEIDEVTAKFNAVMEAMGTIDHLPLSEVDPIPWVADTDWCAESDEPIRQSTIAPALNLQDPAMPTPINVEAPLTVAQLSSWVSSKQISPVELAKAYLDRVDAVDSKVHAFITVMREEAIHSAREAEKEIMNGHYRGPLHGIPIGVKDQIFTEGVLTTSGQPYGSDFVPDHDATIVQRLKQAGAVILGKLNLTVIGGSGRTYYPWGVPANPWNIEHTPGGSSTGSGSAVAACMLPVSIGEDSLGSIRGPAALCGVVGLKTTYGRVSRYGMTEFDWSLDTIGPMGRTAQDCALVLEVIAGHDENDMTTSKRSVPSYASELTGDVNGMRIGVVKELLYHKNINPEMREAVQSALSAFETLGAVVEEISIPVLEHAGIVTSATDQVNNMNLHLARFREHPEVYDYATRTRFLTAALMPASVVSKAYRLRNLIRHDMLDTLSKYDVLIYPGAAGPASPITPPSKSTNKDDILERMLNSPNLASPSNVVGVPSMVLPCGFSSTGLPLGLQITGGMFQEATVLKVGHAYQTVTDWHMRVPQL